MNDPWHGPEERWPRHPSPAYRKPLEAARLAGWHLHKLSGHGWAVIACRRGKPNCSLVIFSTASGGESKALSIYTLIRNCSHERMAPEMVEKCIAVRLLLDEAERLIEAARLLIASAQGMDDAAERLMRAQELADEALDRTAEADSLLDEAAEIEKAAIEQRDTAHDDLNGSGLGNAESSAVLDAADDRLAEAATQLHGVPPWTPGRRDLRTRLAALQADLKLLRAELKSHLE